MFLAALARSATGAERSNVLRADGRRLRAVDDRLGGSANGRGRSTGLGDGGNDGLFDGDLRELSESSDRVGAGLRDLDVGGDRDGLRVGGGRDERLSVASRGDVGGCGMRNERRLRKRLRRRLFERRDLFERLRTLRRDVDDLRRNGV